jgi:hypothetical protein
MEGNMEGSAHSSPVQLISSGKDGMEGKMEGSAHSSPVPQLRGSTAVVCRIRNACDLSIKFATPTVRLTGLQSPILLF